MRKIIVFGGGTSGWLTAAYLSNNLQQGSRIHLIEDASAGPIGVGEGTQPLTAKFLWECGLEPKQWMKPSKATFKHGVELIGWNKEPYFVDNDAISNTVAAPHLYASHYFIDKPYKEFADWHPAYQLAKENLSTKLSPNLDINFNIGPDGYGAVHFSAYDIIESIKSLIIDRIDYTDTKITKVATDDNGITKLIDEKGIEFSADLYLDCSGFKSALLEKTMGSTFVDYKPWLMNDKAVAIATNYTNPIEECHPYTKATAMTAGWRWTIPTYHRVGNGYVYSSDFLSPEEAEKELRDAIGEYDAPAKHLDMKCGSHNNVAVKNVIGIGLAAGFVEPLEATGITFTTATVTSICNLLNGFGTWNDQAREMLNRGFYEMNIEILAFVFAHYYFSNKDDTPYWKAVRKKSLEDLPADAKMMINQYYPDLKPFIFFSQQSMFSSVQWWSMLHAGGAYSNYKSKLTQEEKNYLEYFVETQKTKTEQAKKTFPNHYEYLKGWYESWSE